MNAIFKKAVAVLLTLVMLMSVMSTAVFATESNSLGTATMDDVVSMAVEPSPLFIDEYTEGEYVDDGDGEYYRYDVEYLFHSVTLETADGETHTCILNNSGYRPQFNFGDSNYNLRFYDDQSYYNQWQSGMDYIVTVQIGGTEISCQTYVSISSDTPIFEEPQELRFESINISGMKNGGIMYGFSDDGEHVSYYNYEEWYKDINKVTVITNLGNEVECAVINDDGTYYFMFGGQQYDLWFNSYQSYEERWLPGNTYTEKVEWCYGSSEIEVNVSLAEKINIEQAKEVNLSYLEYKTFYAFTPVESGTYTFESYDANVEFGGCLYDRDFQQIAGASSDANDFKFEATVEAGETYWFSVYVWDEMGSCTVKVSSFVPEPSIENIKFDPITIEAFKNGNLVSNDGYGYTYYDYEYWYCDIDTATVVFDNGEEQEVTLYRDYDNHYFIEFNDETYPVTFNPAQAYEERWLPGNTYTETVYWGDGNESAIEVTVDEAEEIFADTTNEIEYDNTTSDRYYIFKPETSGFYCFESNEDGNDPMAYLYDEDFNQLGGDDDSGDEMNFEFYHYIYADRTYYFKLDTRGSSGVCPITISEVENQFEKLTFEPITITEKTCGNPADGANTYWVYYWWDRLEYTVETTSGDTFGYNGGYFHYDNVKYQLECDRTTPSYQDRWLPGNTYNVNVSFAGKSYTVPVTIKESPVANITVEPLHLYQELSDGEWYEYWDEETGENVNYYFFETQTPKYTVTFKDGSTVTSDKWYFNYQGEDHYVYTDYYGKMFPDNTYTGTLEYNGQEYEFPIYVYSNPIEKIEVEPITVEKYKDGYWNSYWSYETDEEVKYFRYNYLKHISYKVTLTDGTAITGKISDLGFEDEPYIDILGNKIYIYTGDNQSEEHWETGETYDAKVFFGNIEVPIRVSVTEPQFPKLVLDQVTNVALEPHEYTYYSFTPEQSGTYIFESFADDGDPWAYLYDDNMNELADNDDGEDLNFKLVYNLEAGKTYFYGVRSRDFEGEIPVKISEFYNPIQSIQFHPTNVIENTGGYWDYDDYGREFYYYTRYYNDISYTVNFKDGTNQYYKGLGFYYNDTYYSMTWSEDQYSNHWYTGNSYFIDVSVLGQTYQAKINIIENPVESVVVEPIVFSEESGGYWEWSEDDEEFYYYRWQDQIKYTINFIDGTSYEGTDRYFQYGGQEYEINYGYNNDQYTNPWIPGNTYYETITALGVEGEVEISILANLEENGIEYIVQGDCAIITGIKGEGELLEIPETLGGYPVVSILSFEGNGYKEIIIPNSVISLSPDMFNYYDNYLEKLTIGSGVSALNNGIFKYAGVLKEILVNENNTEYISVDGVVYKKDKTVMVAIPNAKTTHHNVPEETEDIDIYLNGSYQFQITLLGDKTEYYIEDGVIYSRDKRIVYSCDPSKTGSYAMPQEVEIISSKAFVYSSLSEVVVSNNVKEIAYYAFAGSEELEKVVLPNTLTKISQSAFDGCEKLSDINIPTSLEILEHRAFAESGIKTANIPGGVEEIGSDAFANSALEELTLGEGIKTIGYGAFYKTKVTEVVLPSTMEFINSSAFYKTPLTKINLPQGLTGIGDFAFAHTDLGDITIPTSVSYIGEQAFYDSKIDNLEFGEGITYLNEQAFSGLDIQSVDIPESVTDIAYKCFENCQNLLDIDLPDNLESLDGFAFHDTAWYDSQPDGMVYMENHLYHYKGQMPENSDIIVSDGTKTISSFAFGDCENIKSIYIPKSVKSIGYRAFYNSGNITDVYYEGSEADIDNVIIGEENYSLTAANWHFGKTVACQHDWADATCIMAKRCTICGVTEGEALGHTWKDATCTEAKTCTVCGITNGSELGHTYDEGIVTKTPTCTEDGVKTFTCACGDSYTETIEATGHTFSDATDTNCDVCGDYVERDKAPFEIIIESAPKKSKYKIGDKLDLDGLSVKLIYTDGSSEIITEDLEISGFDSATAGQKTVTVVYEYLSTTFDVTVLPEATNGAKYVIEDVKARAGSTVEVYILIENNPGIITLKNQIIYDTEALELLSVEDCGLLSGYTMPSPVIGSPYVIRWVDSLGDNNTANGQIAKLVFKIKDDAAVGNYEISIEHMESFNKDGSTIVFDGATANVSVVDYIVGDIDKNGEVNDWDAILLDRYLAAWGIKVDLNAADVDGNNKVDDWDSVVLGRYLAGWDIELKV